MYGRLCRRAPQVCVNSIEAICGYDTGNLNTSMLPLYLAYTPAGEACSYCTAPPSEQAGLHRQGFLQLWGLWRCLQQLGDGGMRNAAHQSALTAHRGQLQQQHRGLCIPCSAGLPLLDWARRLLPCQHVLSCGRL